MKLATTGIVTRLALFTCFTFSALLELPAATKEKGTSSGQTRKEASAAIPYRFLRSDQAHRVHEIVSRPTIYRRLPVKTIVCDQEIFTFLLRNPEVVVGIWRNLGVTRLSMTRRGAHTFDTADGMGTSSQFQLLYGTPQVHLFYGTGYYEGSLLKRKLRGKCVLLVRTAYRRTPQGRMAITNVLDVFVDVENSAVDLAAKTFYPLFIRAADENLVATANFLSHLSYAAETNPDKLVRLAGQLPQVDSDVRRGFAATVQTVGMRRIASQTKQVSDAQIPARAMDFESVKPERHQRSVSQGITPRVSSPRSSAMPRQATTISRYPPEFPRYR